MRRLQTILKSILLPPFTGGPGWVFPSLGGARGGFFPSLHGRDRGWVLILSFLHSFILSAQTIGGNVYGGGNKGDVAGKSTVTVMGGTIESVFGGARMANVGGRAFVNIDGEHATGDVFITNVFGGNDISGTIGTSEDLPTQLTDILTGVQTKETNPDKNAITNLWNAFVRVTRNAGEDEEGNTVDDKAIIIGNVYGGGNGDYTYRPQGTEIGRDGEDNPIYSTTHDILDDAGNVIASSTTGFTRPELSRTYLEIKGGCITYIYGGGNNATITENTTISLNNESQGLDAMLDRYAQIMYDQDNSMTIEQYKEYTLQYLIGAVKMNPFQNDISDLDINTARVFGGNNKADMKINPTWNIQKGLIRDLYSGGNEGRMISPNGILLDINPLAANKDKLKINNVYGGCRRADVRPLDENGVDMIPNSMAGYKFPAGMSARTLVRGGRITNVYGGNDITGTVYGGNAVGIYTSILGDVYGGGNGSYAYTDNSTLANHPIYRDYYYDPGSNSAENLSKYRPHAEQVSIRLYGPDEEHPIIIGGSVYCGGNSASLVTKKKDPRVELKIGNNVIADRVFLGNNGEKMIDPYLLELYAKNVDDNGNIQDSEGYDYSSLNLTTANTFADYMEAVAMELHPNIVFDQISNNDPDDYVDDKSKIGSFFCGGNMGSMAIPGKNTYSFNRGLIIYDKLVGGCNNANIPAGTYNAAYNGGVIGSKDERASYMDGGNIKDRITLNLENLTIEPMRWNDVFAQVTDEDLVEGHLKEGEKYYTANLRTTEFTAAGTEVPDADHIYYKMVTKGNTLEWNTIHWDEDLGRYTAIDVGSSADTGNDQSRRITGGNVYGGCYNSGHVNGNVTINISQDVVEKNKIFAGTNADGTINNAQRNTGVIIDQQIPDITVIGMSVFGGGYGEDTEIWGSTTINANNGYVFQAFGGGEKGVIGKKDGGGTYSYNAAYSTSVSLNGLNAGYSEKESGASLVEIENIYAGGNQGDVCGDTRLYLGNGRIYDAFGGANDADIYGHTEVYIGQQKKVNGTIEDGFPWIRHNVYGGNDFDGEIKGSANFQSKLRDGILPFVYNPNEAASPDVLTSNTYVEYRQGRVNSIFGASEGAYDYTQNIYKILRGADCSASDQESSFVNLRPNTFSNPKNAITSVYGGSRGYTGQREDDAAQDRSYVLVDIPDNLDNFLTTEVFGAGDYNGLGMKGTVFAALDQRSAIVDLVHGQIAAAYGGSYNEGVTRRTVLNVPANSTINLTNLFGGAYGTQILPPCDVYESNVNYNSDKAIVKGAIFGGNNNERRTLFTKVNISAPVYNGSKDSQTGALYTGEVYGAGRGVDTWSEYTEVNMLPGGRAYNVFGGGQMGHVLNSASVQAYMKLYMDKPSPQISTQDPYWNALREAGRLWDVDGEGNETLKPEHASRWAENWIDAWSLGEYYNPDGNWNAYASNPATSLQHVSERAELDDKTASQLDGAKKHNTNVIINEGAIVDGYAYGGGLGDASVALSGDVYGTTYITVLGGEVKKDVYAGGRAGGLDDLFIANNFDNSSNKFTATANAYIKGGTARNVYGGGYEGHVGHHTGDVTASFVGDRPAEAYVVIGKVGDDTYTGGAPAITRNVYGGGEGGSVYGTSHVTMNNGYVGYRYKNTGTELAPVYTYEPELDDQTENAIELAGNVFGGGYVVNSFVDNTYIDMYGGTVRGSLYGGGEVGPIGRGALKTDMDRGIENQNATIFRAGTTQVNMYSGHVLRNVFGGGRGKDSWGGDGTMYMDEGVVASLKADGLFCKGYIFGQTRVNIYGGEIGTEEGMAYGYGNVFGGCDEGTVYSAYHEYYTQAEIDAAEEGDDAYGKTAGDIKGNQLYIGKKAGVRYNKGLAANDPDMDYQGYYYKYNGSNFLTSGTQRIFTEDCKVLVAPHAKALEAVTVNSHDYVAGQYIPIDDLNTLKSKYDYNKETGTGDSLKWAKIDPFGVIIHNAVFAGGNIASGSNSVYANTTTVYGNATASIHDIYNRDLITIGTGHTGGLYGDGNLTFVDGYRELNITNYGTDYHHISKTLAYDAYKILPEREKAYYELKYKVKEGVGSITDNSKTTYSEGSSLPEDEILVLFEGTDKVTNNKPNPAYWVENGVVSVYAGRIMNTIQRADFCGVFGSRMVMKGAQDRVPEEADYTNYTINRVREVSLNKIDSKAGDTGDNAIHGNYFGIYSVVNYLGALTSDVTFDDTRETINSDADKYKSDITVDATTYHYGDVGASYYNWKRAHIDDRTRNNGTCHNHLALASGVYLELTSEESTGKTLETKEWGPITGIIELDLINVQPGIGGGFVYARNEHGVRSASGISNPTLTALNVGAASKWDYKYDGKLNNKEEADGEGHKTKWQTSGNFIHSSQTIIDDCYNISNRYNTGYAAPGGVPAHYWYISGTVYVYDQYISAYTGSPNAYSETVEIPITINAASNGTMTLMDVQPNYYAYYKTAGSPLEGDQKLVINDVSYQLNQPISYWDWNKLPLKEQQLFVRDTYVVTEDCKIGDTPYTAGTVLLKSQYDALVSTDLEGNPIYPTNVTHSKMIDGVAQDVSVPFTDVFRSSNNMSHDTGYLLTYNVTNPSIWDKWYTQVNSASHAKNQTGGAGYEDGPTYYPTTAGLYGQQTYSINAIISKNDYDKYNGYDADGDEDFTDEGDVYGLKQQYPAVSSRDDQATFVPAYIITKEYDNEDKHYYPGAPVNQAITGYTAAAYVSTATIQLSATEYIYVNDLMTASEKSDYITAHPELEEDINKLIVPAYICTVAGQYGGNYYSTGNNYRALEAYSAMSPEDRKKFAFNYDALDLLIDPAYGGTAGQKYQYDGKEYNHVVTDADKTSMIYSLTKPIDYTATYNSNTPLSLTTGVSVTRYNSTTEKYETLSGVTTLQKDDELLSSEFEKLPNERHHYAPIHVEVSGGTYYIVKKTFVHGETPYAVGTTIDSDTYSRLTRTEQTENIQTITFESSEVTTDGSGNPDPFYYCRESYVVGEHGEGHAVTNHKDNTKTYAVGSTVPAGTIINDVNYNELANKQLNFTIHGVSPMETSTLYVARNANINDLSTEKIITVIYKYDYEESDVNGLNITPVSERHVVNIHINFKSGVPTVEDINPPSIVLPGTGITMRIPSVTPGAYEVTGGGWEIFEKPSDAESHINGMEYTPSVDPLYWYQDGFYLAYYAKTYLGKTYSNHVPISVANYHDLKKVMDDKEKHLYVDYDRTRLHRDSKIYINDYSASSQNGLQLFKDFYNLSLLHTGTPDDGHVITTDAKGLINSGPFTGHKPLNNSTEEVIISEDTKLVRGVKGGTNLEFFLRTDISNSDDPAVANEWTSIATGADPCFNGVLHGDGHTISGLDNSLFDKLCGSVYNLGVTGSFTGAGVAEQGDGYVESCWIKTTGTPSSGRAVFGNPEATNGYKQIVNCYYQEGKGYSTTDTGDHGLAMTKPDRAFYNGELAYDLNNFYLYKRYNDQKTNSGSTYQYWKDGEDDPQTGYYANNATLCSSGYNNIQYVEERFADGDFRYAAGEIPTTKEDRLWVEVLEEESGETTLKDHFFPIWPDDYIFFGQKLTYGYSATQAHQDVPTAVVRDGGRIAKTEQANRVYRAPAYYRSKEMGTTYFNPDAYLAYKSEDGTKYVSEKMMTAIDFRGHYEPHPAYGTYGLANETGLFYTPLLDDDGLTSVRNCDVTRNILVYAPKASGESGYINKATHDVLTAYFVDPDFDTYYDNSDGYKLVSAPNEFVYGHLIQDDLKTTGDHLLIDKQDFNCPIAYSLGEDQRMWYQRIPEDNEYVDRTKGWQGISIPFTAELVTTNKKGEITHFYDGSEVSKNGTGSKIGHEYWLRELNDITASGTPEVKTASMQYPALPGDESEFLRPKEVTNTFLWDYYYKYSARQDKNTDIYQKYYDDTRTYKDYPMLTAAKPYIIGFPGKTYFEFDLSGSFEPQNTNSIIEKLDKQIITFASQNTGINIKVSDDEIAHAMETATKNGYTFVPSYMSNSIAAGENAYTLTATGSSYDKVPATGDATQVDAFRPYFAAAAGAPVREFKLVRSIQFSNTGSGELNPGEDEDDTETGDIEIYVKGRKIYTISHMDEDANIRIVNAGGATLTTYTLEAGKKVVTPITNPGTYIVNKKKVYVK